MVEVSVWPADTTPYCDRRSNHSKEQGRKRASEEIFCPQAVSGVFEASGSKRHPVLFQKHEAPLLVPHPLLWRFSLSVSSGSGGFPAQVLTLGFMRTRKVQVTGSHEEKFQRCDCEAWSVH